MQITSLHFLLSPRAFATSFAGRCIILALLVAIPVMIHKLQRHQQQGADAGIIRLTYWCATNPTELALAQELTKQWNDSRPDVQVHVEPIPAGRSTEEVLLAAIAGDTTPDLCSDVWPGVIPEYDRAGVLLQLDQMPGFSTVMNERIPAEILEHYRSRDRHYCQIPWKANPIMIIYNAKIFRAAGITAPPRTYTEYLEAASRIAKDTDGDGRLDQWMASGSFSPIWWERVFDFYNFYLAASDGAMLIKENQAAFENEATLGVLNFFRRLHASGCLLKTPAPGNDFLRGRIATQFTGPYQIAYLEQHRPADFEYDVMPIPVPDGHHGPARMYGDEKSIIIFKNTKHPIETWQFARHLTSTASDLRLMQTNGVIPIRRNLFDDPQFAAYLDANPKLAVFARQIPNIRRLDPVENLAEILDVISREYEACVIYDAQSPEAAVHQMARQVNVILDWNDE